MPMNAPLKIKSKDATSRNGYFSKISWFPGIEKLYLAHSNICHFESATVLHFCNYLRVIIFFVDFDFKLSVKLV